MCVQNNGAQQGGLVDITGLSVPEVFSALYNAIAPIGLGFADSFNGLKIMDTATASRIIASRKVVFFEKIYGRILTVELDKDKPYFDASEFDDLHGHNCAKEIIDQLRLTGDVNSQWASDNHRKEFLKNYPDALRIAAEFANDRSGTRLLVGRETFEMYRLYNMVERAIKEHLEFLFPK